MYVCVSVCAICVFAEFGAENESFRHIYICFCVYVYVICVYASFRAKSRSFRCVCVCLSVLYVYLKNVELKVGLFDIYVWVCLCLCYPLHKLVMSHT